MNIHVKATHPWGCTIPRLFFCRQFQLNRACIPGGFFRRLFACVKLTVQRALCRFISPFPPLSGNMDIHVKATHPWDPTFLFAIGFSSTEHESNTQYGSLVPISLSISLRTDHRASYGSTCHRRRRRYFFPPEPNEEYICPKDKWINSTEHDACR